MNIWYIHPYAGGPGVGRYWRPYKFVQTWRKEGYRARVVTAQFHHLMESGKTFRPETQVDGVPYDFVPTVSYKGNGLFRLLSMGIFSLALFPWALHRAWRSGRPKLIIYSSPHPYGFLSAWLLARLFGAKIFLEVRDLWPLSLVELGGVPPRHPLVYLTGLLERFAYRHSDHVISLLPQAEPHMNKMGLPAGHFTWVPNGVDEIPTGTDHQAHAPLLARLASLRREKKFIVIYAGAHGEPNALHTLLDAAQALLAQGNLNIQFVLVGQGERKASLMARALEQGLCNIDFFDQVDKSIVLQAMCLSHAGYLSLKPGPLFRFGVSPNKLWDYMLAARPVIYVCRAANNPIAEYGCGVSADPECSEEIVEGVLKLSRLPESELDDMGKRGRKAVLENYQYRQLARKVMAIYSRI